jgi:hypothetical protein
MFFKKFHAEDDSQKYKIDKVILEKARIDKKYWNNEE